MPFQRNFKLSDVPPRKVEVLEEDGEPQSNTMNYWQSEDFDWTNRVVKLENAAAMPVLSSPLWPFNLVRLHPESNGGELFTVADLEPGWNDLSIYDSSNSKWVNLLIWLPTRYWGRKGAILQQPRSAVVTLYPPIAEADTAGKLQGIFEPLLEGLEEKGVALILNGFGMPCSLGMPFDLLSSFPFRQPYLVPVDAEAPNQDPTFTSNDFFYADVENSIGGKSIFFDWETVRNIVSPTFTFAEFIEDTDEHGKEFHITDGEPSTEYIDAIKNFWESLIPLFEDCQLEFGLLNLAPDYEEEGGDALFFKLGDPNQFFYRATWTPEGVEIVNQVGTDAIQPLANMDKCNLTPIEPTAANNAGLSAAFFEWYNQAPAAIAAFFEIDL